MPALRTFLLFVAIATLAACDKAAAAGDAAAADSTAADSGSSSAGSTGVRLPVVAEAVTNGDLVLSVNTTGQVRSDAEGHLRAEVGGPVEKVNVRPGDRVRRGQVLLELDPRPFDLAVKEAQAAVDLAELQHQDNYLPDFAATGKIPSKTRLDASVTRSGLAAARVRLEMAKLDQERATIVAPFNGVVDREIRSAGKR